MLRGIGRKWEENGVRERSERKVRIEKTQKKTMVTMATFTHDDRYQAEKK